VGECEVDEDCYYQIVGSINTELPTCPTDFAYAYFDNLEEALEYALSLAATEDNENCGSPVVDSIYGICCDNRCFPFFDSLPYFTNDEVYTCP
jgi:hypothetical protein